MKGYLRCHVSSELTDRRNVGISVGRISDIKEVFFQGSSLKKTGKFSATLGKILSFTDVRGVFVFTLNRVIFLKSSKLSLNDVQFCLVAAAVLINIGINRFFPVFQLVTQGRRRRGEHDGRDGRGANNARIRGRFQLFRPLLFFLAFSFLRRAPSLSSTASFFSPSSSSPWRPDSLFPKECLTPTTTTRKE